MIISEEVNSNYIIEFIELDDWNGFDIILSKLQSNFNVAILKSIDGSESRVWYLNVDGKNITLHNNPYGNYLKATEIESRSYLRDNLEKLKVIFY